MSSDVLKVVIIHGSPEGRAEVRRLLLEGSDRRYEFIEAETGAAGVREALAASPDCVVLDHKLPDMDALGVLAALSGPDGATTCPVVVLTGSAGTDLGRAVMQAGAQAFIGKSWMVAESLTRAIESAVERWAMARELRAQARQAKRSEAESQRVSGLLDTLLRTAPIGFCFIDRDLRYVRINEHLAEMNGIPVDAHVGRLVSEIASTLSEAVREVTGRILATGNAVLNYEFSGETTAAPGVTRFWSESWYPVRDRAGDIAGFGVVVEDITKRIQAEDALRESDQLTRLVLDATLAAFIGVATVDGTLTYANRAPLEAAGIPASEVLGKKFWDCYWWSYSDEVQTQLREAFERAASGEIVRYDVPVRMAGDTRMWIDFQVAPLRDAEGRITHLIPSAMDIALRRTAEEKLRESEVRTRLATEAAAVGIWEWNVQTDALHWDAQMFHIYGIAPTPDGFVKYTESSGAVLPEDLQENERILQDTVRRGGQSHREFRICRRNDGAVRHIGSIETVRANAEGVAEWVVGTNLDVTERRTSEMQLRQLAADLSEANVRKDEFLATLAHELRNPLAPIRSGLQVMKMSGDAPIARKTREMMDRQLGHMVRLVDDLLDVSRFNTGKMALKRERLQIRAIVEQAMEASQPLVDAGGHTLTVKVPEEPVWMDGDLTRLVQVVTNILNNAAKYTARHGLIALSVDVEHAQVVLSVSDNGTGISADMLPKVFDMFAQVDHTVGRAHGGLGIGLSLVKKLVEMHGGGVTAESPGLGLGSTFIMRLPHATPEQREDARGSSNRRTHPAAKRHRLLVVDDNDDGADLLAAMLNLLGHDAKTASDGPAALRATREHRPDLVFLDIGLPGMSGYEVAERLRADPATSGAVLVALTGWGNEDDKRKSREAGFDAHLTKPVDGAAIEDVLDRLLSGGETRPSSPNQRTHDGLSTD